MIKRAAAILFILLANVILLAHAVIPHHHNDGFPSLVKLHSIHSHSCHFEGHDHNSSDHEPDTDNNAYACILKQIVYPPTNTYKLLCQCNNCSNEIHTFQAILYSSNELNLGFPLQLKFSQPPILKSFYSVHVSSCSGLRAPPLG